MKTNVFLAEDDIDDIAFFTDIISEISSRMKLLPREQEIIKEWEDNGTLLASYIKGDTAGIYLVLMANDSSDADKKLSTLPYYPYMKIEIISLR